MEKRLQIISKHAKVHTALKHDVSPTLSWELIILSQFSIV